MKDTTKTSTMDQAVRRNVNDGHFRDDAAHTPDPSEGQIARRQNLVLAFRGVLHCHDDSISGSNLRPFCLD